MTILDLSKINVALPSIEESFHASATQLQFILSGYILAFGLALVPMGRLGDQRSRKALFIIGLAGFGLMSAVGGSAQSMSLLIAARISQGVFAGIQMPQVIGTIQELFSGPARGRAFGLLGSVIGIATAIGPTLGGLLVSVGTSNEGWRWVFWTNVPLAVLAIIAVIVFLPDTSREQREPLSLDPWGIVLFGLSVLTLLGPFVLTTGGPSDDPRRWWLLVPCVVFLAAFIWWEGKYALSGKAPLIPLKLFRIPSFRNGTVVVSAYFAGLPAIFLLTTLFLQVGAKVPPLHAGLVLVGCALTSAISAWIGGNLVARYGRRIVIIGLTIVACGALGLAVAGYAMKLDGIEWVMALALSVIGIGAGFVVAPNQALTLAHVPVAEGGLAGSVGQLGQRVGTAIGSAVALSAFYATIYHESGTEHGSLQVFRDAFAVGMLAVTGFILLALLMAVIDLRSGKKNSL